MQTYDLFDIIGPRMVGPSSSHTAFVLAYGGRGAAGAHGQQNRRRAR